MENKRGLLIVMSGPSGVGKGTIRQELFKSDKFDFAYNQLNEISPISYTNFQNMFNNKTQSIRYSTLTNLCNIFNCQPTDLFINK